ncbi:DEAD/DEAH box helicase [Paenibacillus sp. y28]|uniref:DEAD/DEAH box helicase n=1 Tax=Paenibacillus sp. y28 TaxID=3129110 RepID=UPI00301B1DA2
MEWGREELLKAALYGVCQDGLCWTWYVSLDMRVDVHLRLQSLEGTTLLWLLEPQVSLGQAVLWSRHLNQLQVRVTKEEITRQIRDVWAAVGFDAAAGPVSLDIMELTLEQCRGDYRLPELRPAEYLKLLDKIQGKALLQPELLFLMEQEGLEHSAAHWASYLQAAWVEGQLAVEAGMRVAWRRRPPLFRKVVELSCLRCGSGSERMVLTACPACGGSCPYCEECLHLGRNRFCSLLIHGLSTRGIICTDDKHAVAADCHTAQRLQKWGLSEPQTAAVQSGLAFLKATEHNGGRFLIWAVTGAGKTEMIYPLVEEAIERGGRVLLATPRRDVVLELQPRLAKAFPAESIVTLYGGSEQRWQQGRIVLATTHQLLRFWRYFDLVIIDELDAFPYHNNPMLAYAAEKARKPEGKTILLSATPPKPLEAAAARGKLPHVKVPVRFHRHPLPVPRIVRIPPVRKMLLSRKIPAVLMQYIAASVSREAQLFIFVSRIALVDPFVSLLRDLLPGVPIEGTYSHDKQRGEKVIDFRNRGTRILVTTTILERGVTVPKSDVFILDADSSLFDEASLVQMAGRAGRSMDDPAGQVIFASPYKTNPQTGAVRQINAMNRIAQRRGYLRKQG